MVDPLSWLLSNEQLGEVHFVKFTLPHGPGLHNLTNMLHRGGVNFKWSCLVCQAILNHTPPVEDLWKIFHRGCVDFKWNNLRNQYFLFQNSLIIDTQNHYLWFTGYAIVVIERLLRF